MAWLGLTPRILFLKGDTDPSRLRFTNPVPTNEDTYFGEYLVFFILETMKMPGFNYKEPLENPG